MSNDNCGCDSVCRSLSLLTGDKGDAGANGLDGTFGANSDLYIFSTATVGNPTNTKLIFDNLNVSAATSISVSNVDGYGNTVSGWLNLVGTSDATLKAFIRVNKEFDSTAFAMYAVTAQTANAGYYTYTITYVGGSSNSPFALNDNVIFSYVISGNNGAAGAAGTSVLFNNCTIVDSGQTGGVSVIQTGKTFSIPANTFLTNGSVATIEATAYCDDDRSLVVDTDQSELQILNNAVTTTISGNGGYSNRYHAREWRVTINRTSATTALVAYHVIDNQQPVITYFTVMTGLDFTQVTTVSMYASATNTNLSTAGYVKTVRLYIDFKAF
jgi:hypothetical protein